MKNEKLIILYAMAKIPGLQNLDIPVEDFLDDAEFEALTAQFNADMEGVMKEELELNFDDVDATRSTTHDAPHPMSAPSSTKSQRITIRIPATVLAAFKEKARKSCVGYQTLINRALRSAMPS